jgi:hypothetical protein
MNRIKRINYLDFNETISLIDKFPIINKPFNAHVYWKGEFNFKQYISIKSFFYHHKNCHLSIWLDISDGYNSWEKNIYLKKLYTETNSEIRLYDPVVLSYQTSLQDQKYVSSSILPIRSDYARYLILFKYGGLYFDLDMIFLKSVSCLTFMEFVYQWSITQDGNNALMFIKKNSIVSKYILKKCKKLGKNMVNSRNIFQDEDINLKTLINLPSQLFDPLWIFNDRKKWKRPNNMPIQTFNDFFTKPKKNTFFNSFTYHWHNRWSIEHHPGSWFSYFINMVCS